MGRDFYRLAFNRAVLAGNAEEEDFRSSHGNRLTIRRDARRRVEVGGVLADLVLSMRELNCTVSARVGITIVKIVRGRELR